MCSQWRSEEAAMMTPRRTPRAIEVDLEPDDKPDLAADFRDRIEAGEYRHLLGDALNSVIQQAAEAQGLDEEIGMLRVVLARLLIEEEDPARLAANAARIAHVSVQAARARHALRGDQAGNLTDAITRILTELDG